jgi:hypothetical protein
MSSTLHKLIHAVTAADIPTGTLLRCESGPLAGQTWKYEDIHVTREGEPSGVHCSRGDGARRAHRVFPDHALNTKIVPVVDIALHAKIALSARQAWVGFVTMFMAAVVAYVVTVAGQAMFHV